MRYLLKIHRWLLRYSWFRNISFLFAKDYTIINDNVVNAKFVKQFKNEYGQQVIYGPFSGLKYASFEAYGSKLMPKLIGTYEHELHHLIENLSKRKSYSIILDIGAAEGYYAVGLARIFKNSRVIAFETSAIARKLIKEMALINNVASSIQIEGECTIETLNSNLNEHHGLIICDCEGQELLLLDTEKIPKLFNYDIIVELHDYSYCGLTVTEVIKKRFEKSHSFNFINIQRNKPIGHLKNFKKEDILKIADESRAYSVGWAFLEAK